MRILATFGALTVAAGLFAACSDDDGGDGNTAGTGGASGGSAGRGGTAGTGGTAGNGTGGTAGNGTGGTAGNGTGGTAGNGTGGTAGNGTGGTAGNGTAGTSDDLPDAGDGGPGDGGSDGPCTGCLELRATFVAGDDPAFFQSVYDTAVDFSTGGATITFRVSALSPGESVAVTPYMTDNSGFSFAAGNQVDLLADDGFVDAEVDVDNDIAAAGFDPSDVIAVGLLVSYTGGIGAEATQDVAVLLDSVTFTVADTDDLEFTTDAQGFAPNAFAGVQTTSVIHH